MKFNRLSYPNLLIVNYNKLTVWLLSSRKNLGEIWPLKKKISGTAPYL